VRAGVVDIVVSPGARSQALALAAAALARAGQLALHVRVDERVAGFTALGLAIESRRPVAVVCTSGTAVANLHPAVLEAHHSGVPLIVLSADRPAELRGIGANQTTVQPGIFSTTVRAEWDIAAPVGASDESAKARELGAAAVLASVDGPVHLNLAYREPLSGVAREPLSGVAVEPDGVSPAPKPAPAPAPAPTPTHRPTRSGDDLVIVDLQADDCTVVIAGHGAGPHAEALAVALGAPLIAEVSSGARFGRHAVVAYRDVLRGPHGAAVARAIVFGHPTLSREVPQLLERSDVDVIIVRTPGVEPYNPGRRGRVADEVRAVGTPDPAVVRRWVGGWVSMSRAVLESQAPADPAPDLSLAVSENSGVRAAFAKA
jgi:2-succinyl-5-enolpyruvyl-6-hydroxy-3-cyclohexene-1-carboxylate synthase